MLVLGVMNNSTNPGYLNWIKTYNHVMLLNPKHVSTLPSYVDIINGIFSKIDFLTETTNPDNTDIKDNLILHFMTDKSASLSLYPDYSESCKQPSYHLKVCLLLYVPNILCALSVL